MTDKISVHTHVDVIHEYPNLPSEIDDASKYEYKLDSEKMNRLDDEYPKYRIFKLDDGDIVVTYDEFERLNEIGLRFEKDEFRPSEIVEHLDRLRDADREEI